MNPIDEAGVRQAVEDVVNTMMLIPADELSFPRGWWPAACCEQSACAIAAVLEDRGLGSWTMVSGHRGGAMSGHSWLVLKDESAADAFSIDVTLHQFPFLAVEPFVGVGESPARGWFTNRVSETIIWEWPYLGDEDQPYKTTIRQVRQILAAA